jgi:1-acyl-sn-glycerol-3-phosphate acyltransferase
MSGRRLVTVPVVVAFELLLIATCPLTLAVGLAASALARSSRPVRSVALLVAYAVIELQALSRVVHGVDDWDAFVREVLDDGYRAMHRILDVQVVLEAGSATTEQLHAARGVIVLARHCGPGDSLFIAWLLATYHQLSLRIVLKNALRWEPAVDLAGDHLPLCFVGHGGGKARRGVHSLAASLECGDALLIFPEGGNFSWERWRDALRGLTARGEHFWAQAARRRTHTLPPRPGGALAALAAAPDADVLLLAHSGFAADGRDRRWWRLPVHRRLTVRTVLIRASSVPREQTAARAFLDRAWTQVDTWVEGHSDLAAAAE